MSAAGAVVVGGASGLGAASARALHGAGLHVTVVDRDGDGARALAAELGDVLRHAARVMGENEPEADGQRGVCVLTASIAAEDGQAGQVAYAASKAGVAGMALPAARDLAPLGVRVCAIAPGTFETPLLAGLPQAAREQLARQVPWPPRLGRPDELGSLVLEVVRNRMLNGTVLRLDGALRMGFEPRGA